MSLEWTEHFKKCKQWKSKLCTVEAKTIEVSTEKVNKIKRIEGNFQTCYSDKISKLLAIIKNDKFKVLVSLNVMKLVYEIYIPFQWHTLYNMIIQKHAVLLSEYQYYLLLDTPSGNNYNQFFKVVHFFSTLLKIGPQCQLNMVTFLHSCLMCVVP